MELFDGVFARGAAAAEVGSAAWLQAMLDAEAALARAGARAGVVPAQAADEIAAACRAEHFDAAALGRAAAGSGNPVVPLVQALRAAVGDGAAACVHRGATSQDILDSAAMLVARRALEPLLEHRATPMIGRTLLQQAVPTTFGLKAAGWLSGIDEARRALAGVELRAQLGGAAGTLGALGDEGPAVARAFAAEIGLAEPVLPWHTIRVLPARLASALGVLCGALGKAARDVALLSQDEVGEVREARGGGSSSMPHKRNPVAAVSVLACAERAPGLVATMQAAMIQEHERAAGAWHAEWETLSDLLRVTGSAAAWAREMLSGLEVDAPRMRANLESAVGGEVSAGAIAALVDRALAAHRG